MSNACWTDFWSRLFGVLFDILQQFGNFGLTERPDWTYKISIILRSISSHAECEFFCFGILMVIFIQLKPNFFSNWLQLNNGYRMRKSPCVQLIYVLINWTYFVKSTPIKHVLQTLIIGEYHEPCSIGGHLIDHRIVTQKCFFCASTKWLPWVGCSV